MWIIYLSLLFLPSWLCYAQDGWLPGDEQNHFLTPSGSWEGDANLELKKEIWPLGSLQRIMWRTNMTGHAIGLVQDINPQKRWSNIVRQIASMLCLTAKRSLTHEFKHMSDSGWIC